MQPLIELRGINKIYNSGELAVQVLHDVSLEIHRGEFVAIIGSSGSGKSTLMNILGCLDRPSSGEYLFAGRKVSELDRDRKSTRLNSSHVKISYAVFCLKKKKKVEHNIF